MLKKPTYEELENRIQELERNNSMQIGEVSKASQDQFRLLYERAPLAYQSLDEDGILIMVNISWLDILGYSREEVIGKSFSDFLHPDWKDHFKENFPRFKAIGEILGVEFEMVKKDGSLIFVSFDGKIGQNQQGHFQQTHCIFQDITEHKQIEETLRESESLKNTIIESSPDCIKLLDLEGNLKYMSKGGQEKLEIKDINIYLNKCWIDFWQGKDNINARIAVDTAVKGNIGKFRGYSPTETGKPRWWDVIITPILGSNGEVAQLLSVSRDITDQKQMEDNLRQAQKMESIGTLTGGIAHDFNNIMGIILGNAELALEDVPEWNPAHSNLEEIKTASLKAANIVRQLLSFSRKTDQKLQPMEIAIVIKDALKFLRSTIPTTINIEPNISVTDETILADPTQINQVMMNLCINASHAMEQTGGKLTINVENVTLDNNSVKDYPDLKSGNYVKIMVSDTGSGIDPKTIDRIFDPYFTTKGVGKGSGMGLAVVLGIVKSNSGSITVDSTLGKGTKFSILFPLAQGKAAVEAEKIQEIPGGSETILFVDDEISIVNMVQKMFERLGYKIQTATIPQDALDRFTLNPDHFDLVITDMTMPQMTGVNLSEKLMDIRPDIPIIICTGHSALVDEEKAKELGLAAYVMKPINIREIAQTIRKVLDKN